jgi:hypothetical protein
MRANKVFLQLRKLIVLDADIAQRTEAGVDAVVGIALAQYAVEVGPVVCYTPVGGSRNRDGGIAVKFSQLAY